MPTNAPRRICALPPLKGSTTADRLRNTARWRKLRETLRTHWPLCCNPFALPGHTAINEQVHHVIGANFRPDLFYRVGNLAPLCNACHQRVEKQGGCAHLFADRHWETEATQGME